MPEAVPAFVWVADLVAPGASLLLDEAQSHHVARVCREWEAEARAAEASGVRVALVRTGVVLGRGGGALARLLPPFKLFEGKVRSPD